MKGIGIKHVTTTPYHPSSNGQVERAVQIVKYPLRSGEEENVQGKLSKFLFKYRITLNSITGLPPAELLMGHCPRSRLETLVRHLKKLKIREKGLMTMVRNHVCSQLEKKELAKNLRPSRPKWLIGEFVKFSGPLSYVIKLTNDTEIRRHVDYVRKRDYVLESLDSVQIVKLILKCMVLILIVHLKLQSLLLCYPQIKHPLVEMLKRPKQLHLRHQLLHIDHSVKEDHHNVMDSPFYTKGGGI